MNEDRITSLETEIRDLVKVATKTETRMDKLESDVSDMKDKLDEVSDSIRPLIEVKDQINVLVDAFKSASYVVSLIKGLAALGLAMTAIYGLWKGVWQLVIAKLAGG